MCNCAPNHFSNVDGQIDPFLDVVLIGLLCMLCGQSLRIATMLICNQCSRGWHMGCFMALMKEMLVGKWFCPQCNFLFPGPTLPFSFHFFFFKNFFSFNSHHTDLPIAHFSPTYQLTTPPPPLVLVYAYLPTTRVLLSPPPPHPPHLFTYLPTLKKKTYVICSMCDDGDSCKC